MTRDVATQSPTSSAVAKPLDEPGLSPRLASAVSALTNPHPDIGPRVEHLPDHNRVEAEHALRRYEALCGPAGPDRVRRWLLPIGGGVRNPPSPEDFASKAGVIAAVVGELPAAVLTSQTQRMALSKFQFWPSVAEIHELLRPEAAPLIAKRDALRRIVAARHAPVAPTLTAEERDRIATKFRADLSAVMTERATAPVGERPKLKSAHLTGEALARMRAAAGARQISTEE